MYQRETKLRQQLAPEEKITYVQKTSIKDIKGRLYNIDPGVASLPSSQLLTNKLYTPALVDRSFQHQILLYNTVFSDNDIYEYYLSLIGARLMLEDQDMTVFMNRLSREYHNYFSFGNNFGAMIEVAKNKLNT